MAKPEMDILIQRIKDENLDGVNAALSDHPELARHARPVLAAAGRAWIDGLEALTARGADLNLLHRGYRPLHACIQEEPHAEAAEPSKERLACVRWLLDHGADPDLFAAWPAARALLIAAFTGSAAFVELLIEKGAEVNGHVSSALGDVAELKRRVQQHPSFSNSRDGEGLTVLQCCCASRMPVKDALYEIAAVLLDDGADAHALTPSWSHEVDAVSFAVAAKQPRVFELLLQRGVGPNQALRPAIWSRDLSYAGIALRYGANLDEARDDGKPLLNQMIRWGQLPQALWLIEQGASPNIADNRGWTAAHQAASRGNETLWRAVIEAGADLKRKNPEGDTAADIARDNRRTKLLQVLDQTAS